MRKLLIKICKQLVGIAYDDLNRCEQNIVDLLIADGYIERNGDELRLTNKAKK